MVESPKCPKCGVTMSVEDTFGDDFDLDRGYMVNGCYGYCPICHKKMQWIERFERVRTYDFLDGWGEDGEE